MAKRPTTGEPRAPLPTRLREAISLLKKHSSKKVKDGMSRYGIVAPKAFGVPVSAIRRIGKQLGRDHELADALWQSGWYEARMLTAFVAELDRLTPSEMDRRVKDFDNWAICDTLCFGLWDQSPLAWGRIAPWCRREEEFVRRSGFVLIACLAGHDKATGDGPFLKTLPLIERGAQDGRNFVKKGVSWALRMVGRRSRALNAESIRVAERLAASTNPAARWVGKDALRELSSPAVQRRVRR